MKLLLNVLQIRYRFGCYDEILLVGNRKVRHCNWVRFLRETSCQEDVNIVGELQKGEAVVFRVTSFVPPNGELLVHFSDSRQTNNSYSDVMTQPVKTTSATSASSFRLAADENLFTSQPKSNNKTSLLRDNLSSYLSVSQIIDESKATPVSVTTTEQKVTKNLSIVADQQLRLSECGGWREMTSPSKIFDNFSRLFGGVGLHLLPARTAGRFSPTDISPSRVIIVTICQ